METRTRSGGSGINTADVAHAISRPFDRQAKLVQTARAAAGFRSNRIFAEGFVGRARGPTPGVSPCIRIKPKNVALLPGFSITGFDRSAKPRAAVSAAQFQPQVQPASSAARRDAPHRLIRRLRGDTSRPHTSRRSEQLHLTRSRSCSTPTAYAHLFVDIVQMPFDGCLRYQQGVGELAVGKAGIHKA